MATSPLHFSGGHKRRNCYVTPTFSGVPNVKRVDEIQKWLPQPGLVRGPEEGRGPT